MGELNNAGNTGSTGNEIAAAAPMADQTEFDNAQVGHGGVTEAAGDSPQLQETALVDQGETKPVKQADNALTRLQNAFIAANPEFEGLDFVNFGEWVTLNKLGQFIYFDDEQLVNPDKPGEVVVIIAGGKRVYQLWADIQNDKERKGLLVFGDTREVAERMFYEHAATDPGFGDTYDVDDIKLRFMVIMVPEDSDPEFPTILLQNYPQTGALAFGKYASRIFTGRFKGKYGINKGAKIAEVLSRVYVTSEKNKRDASITYAALNFEPLGYARLNNADGGEANGEETTESK